MRVLILGAGGLLGHHLMAELGERHETWAAARGNAVALVERGLCPARRLLAPFDAAAGDQLVAAFGRAQPHVVINAVGLVRQRIGDGDEREAISTNALFPQRVAELCRAAGVRLIHISTDCVFSGRRGFYHEDDQPDPTDLYGRSKLLGEVSGRGLVTLRTSFVGRELGAPCGLLEWLLHQTGPSVPGHRNAIFSGLSAPAFARLVASVIEQPQLQGLHHVATAPISKLELLRRLVAAFELPLSVVPQDEPRIDRSLDGRRFEAASGIEIPSWETMAPELATATSVLRA